MVTFLKDKGKVEADDIPVVVEKPFTQTTQEADKIIGVAKEKGKLLIPFQNRRWVSYFQLLYLNFPRSEQRKWQA